MVDLLGIKVLDTLPSFGTEASPSHTYSISNFEGYQTPNRSFWNYNGSI